MLSDESIALSKARLDLAKERLGNAEQNIEIGGYKTAANRSYYAVFSAMRAVLALEGFDSKKHSGVIAKFREHYIKTEIFPAELSKIINDLADVRQGSDYDDFYVISKNEVSMQLQNAECFVAEVEKYLQKQYSENK